MELKERLFIGAAVPQLAAAGGAVPLQRAWSSAT